MADILPRLLRWPLWFEQPAPLRLEHPAQIDIAEAHDEIVLLRKAVVRFGDRSRMATVEPPELQQAIDRAFETSVSDGPGEKR